jgi:hypothetical protein
LDEGSSDTALMNRIRRELLSLEESLEAHERQRLRLLLFELERFTLQPSHPATAAHPTAAKTDPKAASVQTSANHAFGYTDGGDASSDEEAPFERLPMQVQQRGPSRVQQSEQQQQHFHQHIQKHMFPQIIPFQWYSSTPP